LNTIDRIRERLILLLWSGSLFFLLYAIYEMPFSHHENPVGGSSTTTTTSSSFHAPATGVVSGHYHYHDRHHHLRGSVNQESSTSSLGPTYQQLEPKPFLEEESRAIDMLRYSWKF
jgi:hypothetical protein